MVVGNWFVWFYLCLFFITRETIVVVLGVCAIVFAGMEDETPDLVLYRFWGRDFLSCPWMCLPGSSRFLFDVSDPLLWRFGLLILKDFTSFHFSPA